MSLTGLPENLVIGEDIYLSKNLNEKVIKDAEKLKDDGKIGGKIFYDPTFTRPIE